MAPARLPDSFTFLITTDNHLGYKEDDAIRRKDSYAAFKEALAIARSRSADFVLLGGDLFHVNKPSASVEHKCIKIIRQHMSSNESAKKSESNDDDDKGPSFKRVYGTFSHFHKLAHPNFEDPNLNVACPIMTIHGNHDDPTGPAAKSVCEKLATCGLLNYFGVITTQSKEMIVEPIILQKGPIKIALYGMGFIPDYKLRVAFEKGDVVFKEPPPDTLNVLVVHQNRVPFCKTKYIPDEMYPKFFHLIVRGHEHQTMAPEQMPDSQVDGFAYQPGSTVATSISSMEAAVKKVGFVTVSIKNPKGDMKSRYQMDVELIDLKCCRRILLKDITRKELLADGKGKSHQMSGLELKEHTNNYVSDVINKLLKENTSNVGPKKRQLRNSGSGTSPGDEKLKSRFALPLVRIRLEYVSKNERIDDVAISAKFYPDRVANKDIILFKKQKLKQLDNGETVSVTFCNQESAKDEEDNDEDGFDHINLGEQKRDNIEAMIEHYFKDKPMDENLQALSLSEYTNAVRGSCEDGNVISKVLSIKKAAVFKEFKMAIRDQDEAREKFHDADKVRDWFLAAFVANGLGKQQKFLVPLIKQSGDEYEEVMIIDD